MADRITDEPGWAHIIAECPDGHQFVKRFRLGIPLDEFARNLMNADQCPLCGQSGCAMLTGKRYGLASEKLAKEGAS